MIQEDNGTVFPVNYIAAALFFAASVAVGRWLLDWNDEAKNLYIYEYFLDLPAVIEYLKNNGVLTKDVYPSKGSISAALDEIQEERPDDISWMLEEFVVVDD